MSAVAGALAMLAIAACGDDDGPPAPDAAMLDAGPDAEAEAGSGDTGARVAVEPPAPPAPPALPNLLPCPDGWREVDTGVAGARGCDPWPSTGRVDDCPAGEAHFPGEPGCASVGTPCAADAEWATDLPSDRRIVYVRAGATGGDGTRTRPYGTIARGLQGAAGSVVALSKGTYTLDGTVSVAARTIWGACAAETVIVGTGFAARQVAVALEGADGAIRNVTIRSSGQGIVAASGSGLVVEGVVIESPGYLGIHAFSPDVELLVRSVVVRDTRVLDDAPTPDATALFTELDAHVTVERARLEGCTSSCVFAGPSSLEMTGVSITRVSLAPRYSAAVGIIANQDPTVHVTSSAIEAELPPADRGSREVYAGVTTNMGARLTLERSVIRGGAFGAAAVGGSTITLSRVWIDRPDEGVIETTDGSTFQVTDLVARGGGLSPDAPTASGIEIEGGGSLTVTRAALADVATWALNVHSFSELVSTVVVDDLTVRDVRIDPQGDLPLAFAIGILTSANVMIRRADIEHTPYLGVTAEAGSEVVLEDISVRDTRAGAPWLPDEMDAEVAGFALNVVTGAHVTVRRMRVERSQAAAIVMFGGGGVLDAEDVEILRTAGYERSGRFGIGIVVMDGVQDEGPVRATLRRTRIEASHEVGLLVQGRFGDELDDVRVDASDLEVVETESAMCPPACDVTASGVALSASFGAALSVDRFRVAHAAYAGALFDPASTVRLSHGEIVSSQVGVLYSGADAFDPATVLDDVTFADNLEDIVTREVAVPQPPGTVVEP